MGLRQFVILVCVGFAQSKRIQELSCSQIQAFVDGHNSRRLLLASGNVDGQPPAAEMNSMVWDIDLANKALVWANKHKKSHNPNKMDEAGRFHTGENIYWYSTTDQDYNLEPDTALEAWFKENQDYEYAPLEWSDFSGVKKQIGHYTQMVWSNSVYVGCGISMYTRDEMKKFMVVCNYGPMGNYIGQTPYKKGPASNKLSCAAPKNCTQIYSEKCPNL